MNRPASRHPVVGVLANRAIDGNLPTQAVDEKYLDALVETAGVSAIVVPALGSGNDLAAILGRLDGIVLTGAISNVHPAHFNPLAEEALHCPFDPERDQAALDLIKMVLSNDIPLFAICRGMQELNVACGGSLVHNIFAGGVRSDHRPWEKNLPPERLYAAAHEIVAVEGGWFSRVTEGTPLGVNSVHAQAIDRLGAGLVVEACAPDGTIEAISFASNRFALGVQWHPEFMAASNALSRRLFEAFGEAVRHGTGRECNQKEEARRIFAQQL